MMDEETMRKEVEKAKRWNTIIFVIFAAIFVLLLAAVCVLKYQHAFSPAKWAGDRESRYKIVSSMLERNQLIGMTEADVIRLLGGEDAGGQTSFKISRDYFPPESTLVYYLGVDYMDNNWLVISLDDSGIVTDCHIDVT
ncbi:MAG: hypothetical protein HDT14_12460 [Oscillibacter sp.]|nr:hypothetical protein [Oscillibacter sp.]